MSVPWLYWWPMRGEDKEDAREYPGAAQRDPGSVAQSIAERDWARSDYWTEERLVVLSPFGHEQEFDIEVESVPHFNVRGRAPAKKSPHAASGDTGGSHPAKPLTGAELSAKHGFEPIPEWKRDPVARPMHSAASGDASKEET